MKLLHLVASPRAENSNTLRISQAFLDSLTEHHADVEIETVDLYHHDLPAVAGLNIEAKYTLMLGQPISRDHAESWAHIERAIAQFTAADAYLVTVPMWNFTIPYALKYYIDCIVQPGYLFRYDETGRPIPLVLGKKMICVTSRGGDYSAESPLSSYDFQEPYLRAIFGFIGITDIDFINAQPMDITPEWRAAGLEAAIREASALAAQPDWDEVTADRIARHPLGLKPEPIVKDDEVAIA
jgi:FMN-dependent NADH-azoreductase